MGLFFLSFPLSLYSSASFLFLLASSSQPNIFLSSQTLPFPYVSSLLVAIQPLSYLCQDIHHAFSFPQFYSTSIHKFPNDEVLIAVVSGLLESLCGEILGPALGFNVSSSPSHPHMLKLLWEMSHKDRIHDHRLSMILPPCNVLIWLF